VDAFVSDAIPVHLITREAVRLYFSRLVPHGAVLVHISNRYLRLEPVLGNIARNLRLTCRAERHVPPRAQLDAGASESQWVLMARSPGALGRVASDRRWHPCAVDRSAHVWTDDYSSVLSVVKWG